MKLVAALMGVDSGGAAMVAKAAPKALTAVQAFRTHLASDPRIRACDVNPFGINVSLRAALDGPLAAMEAVLAAA